VGESELTRGSELKRVATRFSNFVSNRNHNSEIKIADFCSKMARLAQLPKTHTLQNLPDKDKLHLATQWLIENPDKKPTTAARIYRIRNELNLQQAWRRKKESMRKGSIQRGGQNRVLSEVQHQALNRYTVDNTTAGGMGATKQIIYSCVYYLKRQEGKEEPSIRWFQR
jgi:hypothetical protein